MKKPTKNTVWDLCAFAWLYRHVGSLIAAEKTNRGSIRYRHYANVLWSMLTTDVSGDEHSQPLQIMCSKRQRDKEWNETYMQMECVCVCSSIHATGHKATHTHLPIQHTAWKRRELTTIVSKSQHKWSMHLSPWCMLLLWPSLLEESACERALLSLTNKRILYTKTVFMHGTEPFESTHSSCSRCPHALIYKRYKRWQVAFFSTEHASVVIA